MARIPIILAVILFVLPLAACDQSQPALVVVVGGMGSSQLDDLHDAIGKRCPQATTITAGTRDAYKTDLHAIVAAHPGKRIILVGHSLGCQTVARVASELPAVEVAVFIDPSWDDIRLSGNIARTLWYQRSDFGFERKAHIYGPIAPSTIRGSHNSIPHSPELITEVVATINSTRNRPGLMAAKR